MNLFFKRRKKSKLVRLFAALAVVVTSIFLVSYFFPGNTDESKAEGSNPHGSGIKDGLLGDYETKSSLSPSVVVSASESRFAKGYARSGPNVQAGTDGALDLTMAVDGVVGVRNLTSRERLDLLDRLYHLDIPKLEAERLLSYLSDPDRNSFDFSTGLMHVYANQIFALFYDRNELNDDFVKTASLISADARQDEVVRDYALQALSRANANATKVQSELIREILWQNIDDSKTSLPGTALLGLSRMSRGKDLPQRDLHRLAEGVRRYLGATDPGELTRISAAHVAGQLKLRESLPELRSIATGKNFKAIERIAALAAIAEINPTEAIEYYSVHSKSSNKLLARASSAALEKISNR